ncbi:hypothetical protein QJS04_geneDACA021090 [Acorus gramineus]|uniref:Aminotransferase-like plant mobile domain-containing protein n=1 Tax=Acorus gramineus TaxID=55184 RepID=A0AAV9A1B3_ACOGR|nr:hypothetical protein QJS04_geneDACA021090 [Acorus gramineus]
MVEVVNIESDESGLDNPGEEEEEEPFEEVPKEQTKGPKRENTMDLREWHGPIVDDLLYFQSSHMCHQGFEGKTDIMGLKIHMVQLRHWPIDPRIEPYVRASGLYYLTQMGYTIVDRRLLTALIERWRPKTNTFHLEDVGVLTGLPIAGKAVTRVTDCDDWGSVCEELLGVVPSTGKLTRGRILLSWLRENFSIMPDVKMDEVIIQQYARAYFMFVLGCTIFTDGTGNKIHGCWLYLLRDFNEAGRYSWGSAVLAHLYRALYEGSVIGQRTSAGSAGFFALLQVVWKPYIGKYESLPPICRDHHMLWLARVPLICFDIVEMHLPDRVARQFGWHQDTPTDVEDMDRVIIARDINEVLARGAVLYPDSNEWGRISVVTRDLAEAMVEDREQSQYQSSYVASMYDRLDDDLTGADFSESEPMFTIEELFSDLVHLDQDVHEQPHQQSNIPDVPHNLSTFTRPLQTYVRGPRRVFGIIGTSRRPEEFTTPAQPVIPPSQPTDAPSSSAPPAPRKTKTKQNVFSENFNVLGGENVLLLEGPDSRIARAWFR